MILAFTIRRKKSENVKCYKFEEMYNLQVEETKPLNSCLVLGKYTIQNHIECYQNLESKNLYTDFSLNTVLRSNFDPIYSTCFLKIIRQRKYFLH